MKLIPLSVAILIASSAFAQAPSSAQPPILERLCGKLEHAQDLPVKGEPTTIVTKYQNLRHAPVSLYPAVENGQWSDGATPIVTATTGHWGSFQLKTKQLPGGLYWLQVEPDGRKYRMLVRYAPKRFPDQLCTQTVWEVNDAGGFRKVALISVD